MVCLSTKSRLLFVLISILLLSGKYIVPMELQLKEMSLKNVCPNPIALNYALGLYDNSGDFCINESYIQKNTALCRNRRRKAFFASFIKKSEYLNVEKKWKDVFAELSTEDIANYNVPETVFECVSEVGNDLIKELDELHPEDVLDQLGDFLEYSCRGCGEVEKVDGIHELIEIAKKENVALEIRASETIDDSFCLLYDEMDVTAKNIIDAIKDIIEYRFSKEYVQERLQYIKKIANKDQEKAEELFMDLLEIPEISMSIVANLNEKQQALRLDTLAQDERKDLSAIASATAERNKGCEDCCVELQKIKKMNFEILKLNLKAKLEGYDGSALHYFAEHGFKELAEIFLEGGADIDEKNSQGCTPLNRASAHGNFEMAKLLVEKGANVNEPNLHGNTPLHEAAERGYKQIVEFLIESKASADIRNKDAYSPFLAAIRNDKLGVAQWFLEKGLCDDEIDWHVDGFRTRPLHRASVHGNFELVKILVEKGSEVNLKNLYGNTPLHEAAERGFDEIVMFLLQNKADTNIKNRREKTPLVLAIENSHGKSAKLIDNGFEARAFLAENSVLANSLLNEASVDRNFEMVKFLVENGVDINATNDVGNTALHIAADRGFDEILELLLQNKADVDIKNQLGKTPLVYAVGGGRGISVAELLIDNGADINVREKHGKTLLIRSVLVGRELVVRFLVQKGADVNLQDSQCMTALDWAREKGYEELAKFLSAHGAKKGKRSFWSTVKGHFWACDF